MAGLFVILSLISFGYADYSRCRVSFRGTEYKGTVSKSFSGADCRFWDSVKEMRGEDFIDLRFPDGSKRAARNYCRNPSMESSGPWCYILKNELVKELCDIPFCFFSDCRWTGLGEEYNGTVSKAITMEDCKNWKTTKYSDKASDTCANDSSCGSCRNFDNSFLGPWCMVGDQEKKEEKHYCDIPFCQSAPVIVNTAVISDTGPITTFHKISNDSEITVKVRLWDPNEWLNGQIGILISIFDVPASLNQIAKWRSGVFITMGNVGSMIAAHKVFDHIDTPSILSAMQWTNLTLSWKKSSENFMVSLYVNENRKPLLVADVETNNTYHDKKSFQYFSVFGVKSFWDFSPGLDSCLTTTTSSGNKSLWYLMERVFGQAVERIYLKTFDVAVVSLRESFSDGDLLRIHIHRSGRIVIEEISEETVVTISDVPISPLDFSTWNQINVTVIGDSLLITRVLESKFEVGANLTGAPRHLLWFGISSESVSYWSVNCNPEGATKTIKTPDCSSDSSELDYKGFNNIAFSGKFCIPWSDERIPNEYRNTTLFNRFGGLLHSENYCRNLNLDRMGAFCFVSGDKNHLEKQKCLIPSCVMEECKLAGTGTDYSGKLAKTRSGRVCRNHTVCRNPNKSIGGPWCDTDDPLVQKDSCLIQDCEWNKIMLTFSQTVGKFFILPHWKKSGLNFWIKNWDPENDAVLCITMTPLAGTPAYKLTIGGGSNEEIVLKFVKERSETVLFQESASHVIKSGKWTGFWLRCALGHIELGHEKKKRPFFEWESGALEENLRLQPMFLNFGTLNNFWAGVRFQSTECTVERLIGISGQLWPISLWKKEDDVKAIDFHLHGDGSFSIHFISTLETGVKLSLLYHYPNISFHLLDGSTVRVRNSSVLVDPLMNTETWTKITVRYAENNAKVEVAGEILLELATFETILLLYWFKVECISGTLAWSANCEPLELGGEARDGGWGDWSPWSCSAPCGGGEGFRERFCNNPRPNLMGTECVGIDVYRGPCNTFPCGDAPPELLQQLRKRLASSSLSLFVKKGDRVLFPCNADIASIFMENVPSMVIEWVLNGFVFTSPRATPGNFTLELNETDTSDSGVWVCLANWQVGDEDKSTVLAVTSLIVTSQYPTSMVRETLSFNLNCNGAVLGQIYSQLSQKWILNDLTWDEHLSTILEAVEIRTIHHANLSHSGVWMCVISQDELNLTWKTAWIKLRVDPAPNFWSHLIQDMPIFSGMTEQTAKIVFPFGFFLLMALPVAAILVLKVLSSKPAKVNNSILNK